MASDQDGRERNVGGDGEGAGAAPAASASECAPERPAPSAYISLGDEGERSVAAPADTRRPRAVLAALAAACVLLIVVSLGFLHPNDEGDWSLAWLFQTTETAQRAGSSDPEAPAEDVDAAEEDTSGGDADDEASDDESAPDDSAQDAGGSDASASGAAAPSSGAAGAASGDASSSSSSASGSSGGDASSGQGASDPAPAPAPKNTVTVSVSVSSSAVGGGVSGGGTFTFNKGATAYDALCACGLSVNATSSQFGIYVSAIGGLAEFDHGSNSGWMYSVNGSAPNISAGSYVLSDGDSVSWYYVV